MCNYTALKSVFTIRPWQRDQQTIIAMVVVCAVRVRVALCVGWCGVRVVRGSNLCQLDCKKSRVL